MLKNITGLISTVFEGAEMLTEKTVNISGDLLDTVGEEVSINLETVQDSREKKKQIAQLEMDNELEKAKLKLATKKSAIKKLADKANIDLDKI